MKHFFVAAGLIITLLFTNSTSAEIIDGPANLRNKPKGNVVISLNDGVIVDVISLNNNWYDIRFRILLRGVQNDNKIIRQGSILYDLNNNAIGTAIEDLPLKDIRYLRTGPYAIVGAFTYKSNISKKDVIVLDGVTPERNEVYSSDVIQEFQPINKEFKTKYPILATPVVFKKQLFTYCEHDKLCAYDIKSGDLLWKFEALHFSTSTAPTVYNDIVLVGSFGHLHTLDRFTGKELWKFELMDSSSIPVSPVVIDNVIYFSGHHDKYFYAINASSGSVMWKTKVGNVSHPAIHYSTIVFSGSKSVYAIDRTNGVQKWEFKLDNFSTVPMIYDNIVYISDWDGNLYAIDLWSGKSIWKIKIENLGRFNAATDGTLFITTYTQTWNREDGISDLHGILAIDSKTGQIMWERKINDRVISIDFADMIIIMTEEGAIYAVDDKAEKSWNYKMPNIKSYSVMSLAYGHILTGAKDGTINAIEIEEIKKHPIPWDSINYTEDKALQRPLKTESSGLTIEEYVLFEESRMEKIEGTHWIPNIILSKRSKWRRVPPNRSKTLDIENVTSESGFKYAGIDVMVNTVSIRKDNQVLYKDIKIADYPFDKPTDPIYEYKDHWVFEYYKGNIDGKSVSDYRSTVIVDGHNLNKRHKYSEIFNYTYFKDKPFYLFKDKSNKYKLSYNDVIMPLAYDSIVHNACCSLGAFNSDVFNDMVSFFALKNGYWYYVEAGAYDP